MENFKPKNSRKSLRLQSYDYSTPGYYFITICTKNGEHIFGIIKEGIMELNELGKIANRYWLRMPIKYEYLKVQAFIVMPNHVHGIIQLIQNPNPSVGAIHELPLRC